MSLLDRLVDDEDSSAVATVPSVPPPATPAWSVKGGATPLTRGEAQSFARQLLNSQSYRDSLDRRIKNDSLAAGVEQMLWHYGYGKPVEQVVMTVQPGQEDLSTLPVDELLKRAEQLAEALKDARELEDAIPAKYLVQP